MSSDEVSKDGTLSHVEASQPDDVADDVADALKIMPMISNLSTLEQGRKKKEREREERKLDERFGRHRRSEPPVHLVSPQRTIRVLKPAIEEECYAMDYPQRGIVVLQYCCENT